MIKNLQRIYRKTRNNQCAEKLKSTEKIEKTDEKIIKRNCFAISFLQELKKSKKKFNYIEFLQKRKTH